MSALLRALFASSESILYTVPETPTPLEMISATLPSPVLTVPQTVVLPFLVCYLFFT